MVKKSTHNNEHAIIRYRKELLIGLIAGLVTLGLFTGYRWYRGHIERSAHAAYLECMQSYNGVVPSDSTKDSEEGARTFANDQEKWQSVEQDFFNAASNHSWSGLHGVFLAYAAEAQLKRGNIESAIATMEKAIAAIPDAILRSWFEVKCALMKIDSEDSVARAAGLATIEEFAQVQESSVFECAVYHLGNYHWVNRDFEAARSYWNMLAATNNQDRPSLWYSLAKPRLKLVQE